MMTTNSIDNGRLTTEELDLLFNVVEGHMGTLKARSRFVIHAVTIEYYKKRLKRLTDLRHKLARLKQEQITLRFKIKTKCNNDTVGKIRDPDK